MRSDSHFLDYELIDSGGGKKLERFGDKTLLRPSSVAMWRPRLSSKEWNNWDAEFIPGKDDESGRWDFRRGPFEEWRMIFEKSSLHLRLQKNGQVGIFPEHASYLKELGEFLESLSSREVKEIRVLNLFAYTGLASVFCLSRGASVCHVDLSKKALDWAKKNIQEVADYKDNARLIPEDATKFLERETRRGNTYHALIIDPPSFSRVSKNRYLEIDTLLLEIVRNLKSLVAKEGTFIALSCHHPGISSDTLRNLLLDEFEGKGVISARDLYLQEKSAERRLSVGVLGTATI